MPLRNSPPAERGVALAVALFALVVIGGIVASGFGLAVLEQQSGRNTLFVSQASEAAEAGVWQILHGTPAAALKELSVGGEALRAAPATPIPEVALVGEVVRLADNLYLIRSHGDRLDAAGGVLASRSVGLLARWRGDTLEGADSLQPIQQRSWVQLY
jgi:hypothetical protein